MTVEFCDVCQNEVGANVALIPITREVSLNVRPPSWHAVHIDGAVYGTKTIQLSIQSTIDGIDQPALCLSCLHDALRETAGKR